VPIKKVQVLNIYSDVFNGKGKLPGEFEIQLRDNVTPVVHPPRRVPFAIREKLKIDPERMESLGIIKKVTEHTDWVNSLVVVENPNDSFRLCLDSIDLNNAIKRHLYPNRTIDCQMLQCFKN
jgi:hypothetical protein